MAQHDYDIANGSGAAVRADINALAQAIASDNSGTTSPSTTFGGMFWLNTSTGQIQIRNAANTAWFNFLKGGVSDAILTLDKVAAGQTSRITGATAGSQRWVLEFGNATAESGSNAGSNFILSRYDDSGTLIDIPFQIVRSSGLTTISNLLSLGATGQIQFPAAQTASAGANVFDDYEEGTYTPTILGTTTAGTTTYGTQQASYTKIGNTVLVASNINWTAMTGTGNLVGGGLPFTVFTNAVSGSVLSNGLTMTGQPMVNTPAGTTRLDIYQASNGSISSIPIDAVVPTWNQAFTYFQA